MMSCHRSMTSLVPCAIRNHSPPCNIVKTASSVLLLRKISFSSQAHLVGLLPTKLLCPSQLHLVLAPPVASNEILKTVTVLLSR